MIQQRLWRSRFPSRDDGIERCSRHENVGAQRSVGQVGLHSARPNILIDRTPGAVCTQSWVEPIACLPDGDCIRWDRERRKHCPRHKLNWARILPIDTNIGVPILSGRPACLILEDSGIRGWNQAGSATFGCFAAYHPRLPLFNARQNRADQHGLLLCKFLVAQVYAWRIGMSNEHTTWNRTACQFQSGAGL